MHPRHRLTLTLSLSLLSLTVPAAALAGDFVDTRLTVSFGDDDVLHGSDAPTPSPSIGFGDRSGYRFPFDALNSRYSGRESLTHLALYRRFPGFFETITTEASLVAVLQLTEQKLTPADAGSYLRLRYAPGLDERHSLSLTAFPFDSDRFRLGYLYRISVGGSGLFPRRQWIGAPGARLQLDWGDGWYYAGFKAITAETALSDGGTLADTRYAAIGGAGWNLLDDQLRIELGAGYFSMASSPVKDVVGSDVFAVGGAARVVLHHRQMPIEESLDLTLYRNDPNLPLLYFRPVSYEASEPTYLVSVEAVALAQRLADPDHAGQTTLQRAVAGALQARMQVHTLRLELTALYRDLEYLLLETPGLVPYTAFPSDASVRPELSFGLTVDYHFPRLHLTLAATGGVVKPATIRTLLYAKEVGSSAPTLIGENTIAMIDGAAVLLPAGEAARLLVYSRLQARLDFSELLAALVWIQYKHNGNMSSLQLQPDLTKVRVFTDPHLLGFGVSGVVRF